MKVGSLLRKGLIRALGGIPVPAALRASVKTVGTAVQWVGAPNFRQIIRLDAVVDPDAEELTRAIAFATSAYCYTSINYRASKVAEPPMYLAQETPEGGELTVMRHDLIPLLSEPSPDFDMTELLARTEMYLLTTGACAWLKMKDVSGRVGRLMPFSGDEIRTFSDSETGSIYGSFKLLTSGGVWKKYDREDVVYFKEINPSSWRNNLSKLEVALSQLDLGHQVNRTVRNFMKKAMFPGGIVSPDKDWDPEDDEWNEFANTIEAWYGGPAEAGKPLVLQGGATFSRAAIPLKELLPTELLDRIEAVVGSVFGVPPIVVGWKVGLENSPWSQMGQARANVYEETIIPRWGEILRKATRQMLPSEDRAMGLKLAFDTSEVAALRADDLVRAQVIQALQNDWTRDERRAYTGAKPLGPDDPRGDEIGGGTGGALASLTQLGELAPRSRGALAPSPAPSGSLGKIYINAMKPEGVDLGEEGLKALMEGKPLEWVLFDVNTKAAESNWSVRVQRILDQQLKDILRLTSQYIEPAKADAIDPDSTVAFIHALAEWTREKGERLIADGLYPLIVGTGTVGLKRAAAQIGVDFAVVEPGLATYAREEADFLASVMGETTGKKVAAIVQKRLDSGGLLRDFRKDLQESAAFSRSRANLVARTETTRAWNGAQRRSLSEYERNSDETVRLYKTWLNAGDDRVRPEHEDAPAGVGGEKRRIDEPYSNGLQEPSEPLCRCTQTFDLVTVGDES